MVIKNSFGHEIMACRFAEANGEKVYVSSNKENETEYVADVERIARTMRYFCDVEVIPFAERNLSADRDYIAELKKGCLTASDWEKFFSRPFELALQFDEPDFPLPKLGVKEVMMIPQKLVSDEKLGVTAAQQSLPLSVFEFFNEFSHSEMVLLLGQHFHKVDDLEKVLDLSKRFNMLVPGLLGFGPDNLLGLRGVEHRLYHQLYSRLSGAVGIAGTHTWILLTCFPEVPQVILYRKGIEDWQMIARSARRAGRRVIALEFDESTDMKEFSKRVKKACKFYNIY